MASKYHIKELYEFEGWSIQKICAETGHCYRTVKDILERDDWNEEEREKQERVKPVIGPVAGIIDSKLEEDQKKRRNQRRTAKKIWKELQKDHGFTGSYSSVKKYVRAKKEAMGIQSNPGYIPLAQIPGTAQMDFGELQYLDEGHELRKCYEAVLSFPHSNKGYAQVFPGQNQECLFEAMIRIFEHIGGVPERIRFDNMTTAVAKVLRGKDRQLTDRFQKFAMHYGFKPEFCAPAAPESKGNVENKVGYIRRNALTPEPVIENFERFNDELLVWCEQDANRMHYRKKKLISELWTEDSDALHKLPDTRFDAFRMVTIRVNKCGYAMFETNSYGLDPRLGGKKVQAKVRATSIEFYDAKTLVGEYARCYGKRCEIVDPVQYLDVLKRKPNAATDSRFFHQLPQNWQDYISSVEGKARAEVLETLQAATRLGSLELSADALALASAAGRTDAETVIQCMYYLTRSEVPPMALQLSPEKNWEGTSPDLKTYDLLAKGNYNDGNY